MEHFWDKLAHGALVIFDDYGWAGYKERKHTLDDFAHTRGVEILNLPIGQGLLNKS